MEKAITNFSYGLVYQGFQNLFDVFVRLVGVLGACNTINANVHRKLLGLITVQVPLLEAAKEIVMNFF